LAWQQKEIISFHRSSGISEVEDAGATAFNVSRLEAEWSFPRHDSFSRLHWKNGKRFSLLSKLM
jgi:hypothetical protein